MPHKRCALTLAGRESLQDQLGDEQLHDMACAGIMDAGLQHVATRNYSLKCNWKVFADNYLVSADPPVPRTPGKECTSNASAAMQSAALCDVMQTRVLTTYC